MRAGEKGWETSETPQGGSTWNIGRPMDMAWPKRGWGTPFSAFRFAIPEMCGFEGRAIYLDADMLVLGDIAELWEMTPRAGCGIKSLSQARTDVSVIDCAWFKDKEWWPSVAQMKPSGARVFEYITVLNYHRAVDPTLPDTWNDCDGRVYDKSPDDVKLIHYTHVLHGQPYRPYPRIDYPKEFPFVRTSYKAGELWWQYYREALTEQFGGESADQLIAQAVAAR